MQIQPIAAIHRFRNDQKAIVESNEDRDENPHAAALRPTDLRSAPQNIGSGPIINADQSARSSYATQLLADRLTGLETDLDRMAQLAQYQAGAARATATVSYSV